MNLEFKEMLIYYDQAQLFSATDPVGTIYLCMLIGDEERYECPYIAVQISRERYAKFKKGNEDLRNIFEFPESGIRVWVLETDSGYKASEEQIVGSMPEHLLPDPGVFMESAELVINEDIIPEAIDKGNTILHIRLEDSYHSHSVDASIMSECIMIFQNLIKSTYKKRLSSLKKSTRKNFDHVQNYAIRVFDTSPGSLNFHFETYSQKDIFSNSEIDYALSSIDALISNFDYIDQYVEVLQRFKGHPISHLKKFNERIIKNNLNVSYQWYSLGTHEIKAKAIDRFLASRINQVLEQRLDLGDEIKVIDGFIQQADAKNGAWRIVSQDDNKEYRGASPTEYLSGLTLVSRIYRFTCREVIVQDPISSTETFTYDLLQVDEITEELDS